MDPQQKKLLEVIYEAIEAAGYPIHDLRGSKTGVFVGQMTDDYRDVLFRDIEVVPQYAGTGTSRAILANRVSYFFDWHGPSINIDTACSSSLVALHQAVQSLRNGESTLAVAAGSNIILGPETFVVESKVSRSEELRSQGLSLLDFFEISSHVANVLWRPLASHAVTLRPLPYVGR